MTALTMDYFRNLKKGATVTLHYNLYNKGTFTWIHDHVGPDPRDNDDRVWGRFVYEGESIADVAVASYLYEFEGVVCRGSGAEPVHLEMPEDMDENDWDDYYRGEHDDAEAA